MRASGIPYCFFFVSVGSLLLTAAGCSGSRSDRTVRVSQAPAQPGGPAAAVPARLAGASGERHTGSEPTAAKPASATASIDDSGEVVRQANRIEPSGMIGSEGGVDEDQLMAAFEHADSEVREIAKRQYQATVARAQPLQPPAVQPPADSAPAAETAVSQQTMVASTDTATDRGVPTLPGSEQRVADAQPPAARPDKPAAASSVAASSPGQTPAGDARATSATSDAGPSEDPLHEQANAPVARTASRKTDSGESIASADDATVSGDEEKSNPKSDAADDPEPAPLEERLATLDEKQLFEALIRRYAEGEDEESEAAGVRRRINHRLLLMMAGRVDEAVEPLEGLAPSEQEYLRNQILALWTAVDPQGHPVSQRRWTTALPHLREATSYLAAATGKLDVNSLAFCTEVVSFGQVIPFEENRFAAGQEVILYSQVDCFGAERLSDGYETHFIGSYEIFDASGKRVADKVLPPARSSNPNYLRDYLLAYKMHLPSHLGTGSYRMQLTVEDLKGKKYGSSSIAFEIEGPVRAE